jgi:DNA-binding transcriptional MerR regulator
VIADAELSRIESEHPLGLTSFEILEALGALGITLSEATLRKYVQLGLLPRSVRVGQKGKHRGSHGLYPARVLRRIVLLKSLLARDYTLERIQREFPLLSGEVEQLDLDLSRLFSKVTRALKKLDSRDEVAEREVRAARSVGRDLVSRLRSIEDRLSGTGRRGEVEELRVARRVG